MDELRILAALKQAPARVWVDAVTGEETVDERSLGMSKADAAALETALSLSSDVTAVTVGGPSSEGVLRAAWAAGAEKLVRYPPPDAREYAAAAIAAEASDCDLVLCGVWSLDGGSGSVPALAAAALGAAQALGCASVRRTGNRRLEVERRVQGGRLEKLAVSAPAVLSVGPEAAHLRRAGLDRVLDSAGAPIDVQGPVPPAIPLLRPLKTTAYRPRPQLIAPPGGATGDARVRALIWGEGGARNRVELRTGPEQAAAQIMSRLAATGNEHMESRRTP